MKRLLTLAALTLCLLAKPALGSDVGRSRTFGLGFQVGNPTGFTGKAFFDSYSAIDFGIGVSGWGWRHRCWDNRREVWYHCNYDDYYRRYWSLHLDYLWIDTLAQGSARLDWHIGLGGRLLFWNHDYYEDDVGFIARVPIGLDLTFRRPDFLEIFFEIVPGLLIVPGPDFWFDAAIGLRFYF